MVFSALLAVLRRFLGGILVVFSWSTRGLSGSMSEAARSLHGESMQVHEMLVADKQDCSCTHSFRSVQYFSTVLN